MARKGYKRGLSAEEKKCRRELTGAEWRPKGLHWLIQGDKGGCEDFLYTTGKYQWKGPMGDEKSILVDGKRKLRPLRSGYLC